MERDYQRLSREQLTVWDAQHPAPKESGDDLERKLLRWWHDDAQKQIAEAAKSPERFREVVGGALEVVIGRTYVEAGDVEWEMLHKSDGPISIHMSGLIRNRTYGEELPAVFIYPKQWNGTTTIWLSGEGKADLFAADGGLKPEVQKLVAAGTTVMGVDLLHQGEFLASGKNLSKTPRVKNPREAAPYTFGYNHAAFAQRVHDVMSVVKFIKTHERPSKRIDLVGLNGGGAWAAAARALCGDAIDRAIIDTQGFRFGKVLDLHSPDFLPGGSKYGDVVGMLAAGAPGRLWLAGENGDPTMMKARYANSSARLTLFDKSGAAATGPAVDYLILSRD